MKSTNTSSSRTSSQSRCPVVRHCDVVRETCIEGVAEGRSVYVFQNIRDEFELTHGYLCLVIGAVSKLVDSAHRCNTGVSGADAYIHVE